MTDRTTDSKDAEAKRNETFERLHNETIARLVKPGDCDHLVNPRVEKIDPDYVFREVDFKWSNPNAEAWFSDLSKRSFPIPESTRIELIRFGTMLDKALHENEGKFVTVEKDAKLSAASPIVH